MKRAFTSSAKYYEVLANNEARLKKEGMLLSELLSKAPGNRVVDIACGTGIHAEYFGLSGADVDAFDLSPEMIDHAKKVHNHPSVRYHTEDMRKISGGKWDMAVCLGNSLSLLGSIEYVSETFKSVSESLSEGGIFLIQILNYLSPDLNKPRHRVEHRTIEDFEITAVKDLVPHREKTLLTLGFFSFHGGQFESLSETAVLSNWTLDQISPLALKEGFSLEDVYGGFDKLIFDIEKSNDLICVFRRN